MVSTPVAFHVLAVLLGSMLVAQQTTPALPIVPAKPAPAPQRDDSAAEKLGWRLAVQAWTFRDRSAFEAIDTAKALGLKYIELFPGQALGKEFGKAKVDIDMPKEQLAALKQKLAAAGITVTNFGVVHIGKNEAEARKQFEFGKALGLETLSCEPDLDAWDTV
jgi:hypothetical protein